MNHRPIHVMPDMRIIHPDYGDMTEDVARELALLNQQSHEQVMLEADRRQRHIAASCGQEARVMDKATGLRLVAQIDADVFNYWEAREGREFWTKDGELDYMLKRHPELRVNAKSDNPVFGYTGSASTKRIRGKRGRWAA